jgi:tetratricopeptide (TPR) repeat protein
VTLIHQRSNWFVRVTLALGLSFLMGGCAVDQLVSRRLGDALSAQAGVPESDPQLAYEASAFYLKLSESVLRQNPDHLPLAESVVAGFTQYAFAFVSQEADFIEDQDARKASALRQRAAKLYRRAQQHALNALHYPTLTKNDPTENPLLASQVGLAYWAAAAWGGLISLSTDNPEVVADFPRAIQLAQWAWALDPGFGQGGLASLMGTFEASRPGGSLAKAAEYFDQAIQISEGQSAGAYLTKAERWALPCHDQQQFDHLIAQALAVQTPDDHPLSLSNQIMQTRARWLASKADDLF